MNNKLNKDKDNNQQQIMTMTSRTTITTTLRFHPKFNETDLENENVGSWIPYFWGFTGAKS